MAEIGAELENVRAAWQWAIEHTAEKEIQKLAYPFSVFCHFQSRFLEAADIFEKAAHRLSAHEPEGRRGLGLAEVLVQQGWFFIRLGRFKTAMAALEQSWALYTRLGASPKPGMGTDPRTPLAILAVIRGDYAEAAKLGQAARQTSEARADRQNLVFSYYVLTSATLAQGNYEAARQYARQACAVAKAANNRWFLAYCLNEGGNVARALGEYAEAKRHYQASYAIREEFDDPEGMAVALNHLGEVAARQEDFAAAQHLYRQSLAIYRKINDSGGLATSLNGLGQAAYALGAYQAAKQHLQQALEIAAGIQFLPLTFSILISLSELFLQTGSPERGLELLALIRHHPASDQETKDRARQALSYYEAEVAPDRFAEAIQRGQSSDLEATVATLQTELAPVQELAPSKTETAPETPSSDADQPAPAPALVEPLTPRELEVLQLIAAGFSNREIGEELVLALGSVKWYASRIYGKLQVKNRTRAVARARELNLLS